MIKVMQTKDGEEGDCWPACLASLLEVDLHTIPNFCTEYGKTWFEESCRWLRETHNMGLLEVGSVDDLQVDGDALVIGVGESARNRFHAVIFCINKNGSSLAHDPYTRGLGIIEIKYLYILTPFKDMDMFEAWYEEVQRLADKHGEFVDDRVGWREAFDDNRDQSAADAFYEEYPEHREK